MLKYIIKRLISLVPVVFIISIILFGMLHLMPGDPVRMMMPENAESIRDPQVYEKLYEETKVRYGYDKSIPEQYVRWVGRTVSGNLGYSSMDKKPVIDVISTPLKNTLMLNILSTIVAFFLSIYIGIISAVKKGSFTDRFWQVFSLVGISIPTFFIALSLIYIFALKLGWFPSNGMPLMPNDGSLDYYLELLRYLILPAATLTVGSLASTSRYVRNAMAEALSQDYIRTARSKGLSERVVIYSHAFRNALIPVVTVVAWSIVGMFGGAAITEQIFAYNGIGRLLIDSVLARDFNLVLALNMFYAVLSLSANLLMDIGYALVDPRVRLD